MQLNFEGKTRPVIAMERLRQFQPHEGYELAFSGGKDSVVIYDLAVKAGVKFHAVYKWTTVDPPELLRFIKEHYPLVEIKRPEKTMWQLIEQHGQLPLRTARFCCQDLKESGNRGQAIITGLRWAESLRRKQRRLYELCRRDGITHYLHPIIDWSTAEVWQYIRENQMLYCHLYDEGFRRLGCVLCPMASAFEVKLEMERWPKITLSWKHAAERVISKRIQSYFKTGERYFNWWISRKGIKKSESQCVMFE